MKFFENVPICLETLFGSQNSLVLKMMDLSCLMSSSHHVITSLYSNIVATISGSLMLLPSDKHQLIAYTFSLNNEYLCSSASCAECTCN